MQKIYEKDILQDVQIKQRQSVKASNILKHLQQKKILRKSASTHLFNSIISGYVKKQAELTQTIENKNKQNSVGQMYNNLVNYSKKKCSYINRNFQKSQFQLYSKLQQQNYQQSIQAKFLKKYQIPLSIKYTTIRQLETVNEYKAKIRQAKQILMKLKQPLIERAKKIIKKNHYHQNNIVQDLTQTDQSNMINLNYVNLFQNQQLRNKEVKGNQHDMNIIRGNKIRRQRRTQKKQSSKSCDILNFSAVDISQIIVQPLGRHNLSKKCPKKFTLHSVFTPCTQQKN